MAVAREKEESGNNYLCCSCLFLAEGESEPRIISLLRAKRPHRLPVWSVYLGGPGDREKCIDLEFMGSRMTVCSILAGMRGVPGCGTCSASSESSH